ncbi:hypothetical protein GCM10010260_28410 [Streptomyces filipinensis]|uniref:Uncharacterized protein n=1 Tax=Streptomyces filipinensis TaxID=66887 RepID=A0A918I9R0_9ACTN|nr:DUF6518 family protein [Streptomyces filipinensis]GGU92148.1 hypothetical protein GCM10010260_28410 [Streptomyces filipinensis]
MTTTTAGPAGPASRPRARGGAAATAAVVGLLLGVLTNLAQGWLPGAWQQIANSGAVWSTVAFAVGAVLYREVSAARAALGGLAAEAALVVGYYGFAEFGRDGAGDLFFPLVWLAMACVAGPLFGVAGHWWHSGRDARRRVIGLAAPAGLFGMEGLAYAWKLHHAAQAWACLALFVLIPLLMAATHKQRAATLAAAAVFAPLAYAVVELPLQALSA